MVAPCWSCKAIAACRWLRALLWFAKGAHMPDDTDFPETKNPKKRPKGGRGGGGGRGGRSGGGGLGVRVKRRTRRSTRRSSR